MALDALDDSARADGRRHRRRFGLHRRSGWRSASAPTGRVLRRRHAAADAADLLRRRLAQRNIRVVTRCQARSTIPKLAGRRDRPDADGRRVSRALAAAGDAARACARRSSRADASCCSNTARKIRRFRFKSRTQDERRRSASWSSRPKGFTLSKVDEAAAASAHPDLHASLAPVLFTEPTFLFLFLPVLLALYSLRSRALRGVRQRLLLVIASVIFYAKGGGGLHVADARCRSRSTTGWRSRSSVSQASTPSDARDSCSLSRSRVEPGRPRQCSSTRTSSPTTSTRCCCTARRQPVAVPHVVLPIGISFFTFHAISYVVDVYRGDATAQKSPVHAALYLLLFPQLIAGPIIRYRDIADQLARRVVTARRLRRRRPPLRHRPRQEGADRQRRRRSGRPDLRACRPPSSTPRTPGSASSATRCRSTSTSPATPTWRSASAGCSASVSRRTSAGRTSPTRVQEFWRRWHMSLSTWFRDYLYVPLGGNRVTPARTLRNLVTVFFLCGLWHGASWNFVDLGALSRRFPRRRAPRSGDGSEAAAGRRCGTRICCSW